MIIKTITTWNNKLFEAYAHRFQETYNWPFELIVYNEDDEILPDLKVFVERNKHRQPMSDFRKKSKDFLTDGVRFSYKVYAYTHAITTQKADGLICIDADSVFHKKIDEDWVKKHIHSWINRSSSLVIKVNIFNHMNLSFLIILIWLKNF